MKQTKQSYFQAFFIAFTFSQFSAFGMQDDAMVNVNRYDNAAKAFVTFPQKVIGNIPTTEQYGLNLRQAPVVHPYNPTGSSDDKQRIHAGMPVYLFFGKQDQTQGKNLFKYLAFEKSMAHEILQGIADKLCISLHTMLASLEVFVCVQNNPWINERLLLRPHYWSFRNRPDMAQTPFSDVKNISAFVLGNADVKLENADHLTLQNFGISVHTQTDNYRKVISSSNNMILSGIRDNTTTYFWSFVRDEDRFALTMHWLLDDNLFNHFSGELNHINDSEQMVEQLFKVSHLPAPHLALSHHKVRPNLAYIFNFLKSKYPHMGYASLTKDKEEQLIDIAAQLVAEEKVKKDSSAITKAYAVLIRPDIVYIFNYVKGRYTQSVYANLTHDKEEQLIDIAAQLVAGAKAKKDSSAITKAYEILNASS